MSGAADAPVWQLVLIAIGCVLAVGVLAVGALWVIDKLFRRQPSKAEMDEYSRHFQERLLKPDFAAVEAHFGAALPDSLKKLYADKNEILRGDFEVVTKVEGAKSDPWFIAFYEPADAESLRESWPGCEPYFAFANDGCGNEYLIKPGVPDPEVLFHDHETSEMTKVAGALTAFLASPKQTPPD